VSDQDFFFDDDEPKPAKSTKSAKPAAGKAAASGAKPAGSASKPAARKPAASSAPSTSAPSGSMMGQSLGMPIVSLLVVIGLLVGVIAGFFLGGAMQNQGPTPTINSTGAASGITPPAGMGTGTTGTGTGTPSTLTPAQIQQGLPAGHPSVSGAATPTAP
jgi:hypothetical protein